MRFLALCLIFFLVQQLVMVSMVAIAIPAVVNAFTVADLKEFLSAGIFLEIASSIFVFTGPWLALLALLMMAVIVDAPWGRRIHWAVLFTVSCTAALIFGYLVLSAELFRNDQRPGEFKILNLTAIIAPLIGAALATVVVHRVRNIVCRPQ